MNNSQSTDQKPFVSKAPKPSEYLVWADCEMTGLDISVDTLVEIAIVVTNSDLEVVDKGIDIVIHQPIEKINAMKKVVADMHEKSGLTPEIISSTITMQEAESQCISYLKGLGIKGGSAPLCGNSIGVDRRFLDKHMPNLEFFLHYRSVDVSSFKELCRRWYPEIYSKRPDKLGNHRALDDILGSIEELKFYKENLFK